MEKVILASASPRRRELLDQIHVKYEVMPATGEEVVDESLPPYEIVKALSLQKAVEIGQKVSPKDCKVIIGADTVVAIDGKILGKPENQEVAAQMLEALSGNVHSVFTGVSVLLSENGVFTSHSFYEETKVYVLELTKEQIAHYMETGEPFDKAGAYGIQGDFAKYIEKINGDYNNVVGLPVARLYQELLLLGVDLNKLA